MTSIRQSVMNMKDDLQRRQKSRRTFFKVTVEIQSGLDSKAVGVPNGTKWSQK